MYRSYYLSNRFNIILSMHFDKLVCCYYLLICKLCPFIRLQRFDPSVFFNCSQFVDQFKIDRRSGRNSGVNALYYIRFIIILLCLKTSHIILVILSFSILLSLNICELNKKYYILKMIWREKEILEHQIE